MQTPFHSIHRLAHRHLQMLGFEDATIHDDLADDRLISDAPALAVRGTGVTGWYCIDTGVRDGAGRNLEEAHDYLGWGLLRGGWGGSELVVYVADEDWLPLGWGDAVGAAVFKYEVKEVVNSDAHGHPHVGLWSHLVASSIRARELASTASRTERLRDMRVANIERGLEAWRHAYDEDMAITARAYKEAAARGDEADAHLQLLRSSRLAAFRESALLPFVAAIGDMRKLLERHTQSRAGGQSGSLAADEVLAAACADCERQLEALRAKAEEDIDDAEGSLSLSAVAWERKLLGIDYHLS